MTRPTARSVVEDPEIVGGGLQPDRGASVAAPVVAALFDDLESDEIDVTFEDPLAVPALAATAGADVPWPANGPDTASAEEALARGLAGLFEPGDPLRGVSESVVAAISDLERAVLSGEPQPLDPEPIRRAAVMRLRVAAALASAPVAGAPIDLDAVAEFLGEIDLLLGTVSGLAPAAPPDLAAQLEAIRNALVKEAIDFSEAAQRAAPAEAAVVAAVPAASLRAAGTRVLSVEKEAPPAAGRSRSLVVALGVSVVVAAGYHGWRYFQATRIPPPPPPAFSGAPPGATAAAAPGAARVAVNPEGKAFSPADVEAFRAREELQGRKVHEVAPGALISVPAGEAGGAER